MVIFFKLTKGYGDVEESTCSHSMQHDNAVQIKLLDTFVDEEHFAQCFQNNNLPQHLKNQHPKFILE